ncbi:IS481 family transposase, partial [Salmonella enterica subsp. enterica]|nr:IS481 family transposase [Salmonella enterica subsp. enterica serovar Everleigh]
KKCYAVTAHMSPPDWARSYAQIDNECPHQVKMPCGRTPMETLHDEKHLRTEKNLSQM